MDKQPTNQEIFELVKKSSFENQEFFGAIKESFSELEQKMVTKDELKNEFAKFETRMVSKEFFVDKLNEFRGEFVTLIRKEDNKLGVLVTKLGARKVLPLTDIQDVLAMEPFSSSR